MSSERYKTSNENVIKKQKTLNERYIYVTGKPFVHYYDRMFWSANLPFKLLNVFFWMFTERFFLVFF